MISLDPGVFVCFDYGVVVPLMYHCKLDVVFMFVLRGASYAACFPYFVHIPFGICSIEFL